MTAYRYRPEVLAELARHGLAPRPETSPQFLRDAINDLYRHEIRALRDRCRAGEFSTTALPGHVVELRKRYLLLSIPLVQWTAGDADEADDHSRDHSHHRSDDSAHDRSGDDSHDHSDDSSHDHPDGT